MNQRYIRGSVAVLVGSVIVFFGDTLLGVKIEVFSGISTYTFPWVLDIFLVPFIAGLAVALIYKERGGKWLAFLPPIIVRCLSCLHLYLTDEYWNADFFYHLNLYHWGLCVILAAEAANLGGFLGESLSGAYLRNNNQSKNGSDKNSCVSKA